MPEARIIPAERVRHRSERLLQIGLERLRVRTLSGIFRMPSMSSEKTSIRVLHLAAVSTSKALRTIEVRATSPKVPICGRPEGP